jgi:hypothetical protein
VESGPAPAANPALPDDSSESYNYSPSRYDECDALRFKAERDKTRRELEDVSKKVGIAELEWEHQRKQLLETMMVNLLIDLIQLNFELTAIVLQRCSPRRQA